MKDASVYEAASEVRDALQMVAHCICDLGSKVIEAQVNPPSDSSRFVGPLFAWLVAREADRLPSNLLIKMGDVQRLAVHAWELADALDQADPRRSRPASADAAADDEDEEEINLIGFSPEEDAATDGPAL